MGVVLAEYKDGFSCVGSLVDVGGGTGGMIAEIVKAHPHIKGINFDLPHVVAIAPTRQGVSHVGGDMFEAIPNADAIFMKVYMYIVVH
jgi:precorrin-6B methylase 2